MVKPYFFPARLPILALLFFVLSAGVVSAESFTSKWSGMWTADCIRNETPKTLHGSWFASVTETDGKLEGDFSADAQAGCSGIISGNLSGDRMAWGIEGSGCRGRGRGSVSGNNVSGDFGGGDIGVEGCVGTFQGTCTNGCSPICPPRQISCHRVCTDNLTDPFNCGRCNVSCSPREVCQSGKCVSSSSSSSSGSVNCQDGFIFCNGTCVNSSDDSSNCGLCGVRCSSGQACRSGKCVSLLNCSEGSVLCNGTCANTTMDSSNCGGCGVQCLPGQACQNGACVSPLICQSGLISCGGVCVNASADSSNCGLCGAQCLPGQACRSGNCVSPSGSLNCSGALALCNGTCVDIASNLSNCGACGIHCSPGQACVAGKCQYASCPPETEKCPSGCCPASRTDNLGYICLAIVGIGLICIILLAALSYLKFKKRR